MGQWIWQDGLRRGIFTAHSVLLTNLIGPPGLLLHFLTCAVTGKGFPPAMAAEEPGAGVQVPASIVGSSSRSAMALAQSLFDGPSGFDTEGVIQHLDPGVIWEDFSAARAVQEGRDAVASALRKRSQSDSAAARPYAIERMADGVQSTGFTYRRDAEGIRGNVYVELKDGRIAYVREIAEPLFKPGPSTAALLKAVAKPTNEELAAFNARPLPIKKRNPQGAQDVVTYLWKEINGRDPDEIISLYGKDVVYEDLNFENPFVGKEAVQAFIEEFDVPGITFIPERISEGSDSCAFTWRVQLSGVEGSTAGISFYSVADGKVTYVRDIPQPAISPPPLQTLAAQLNPRLRKF